MGIINILVCHIGSFFVAFVLIHLLGRPARASAKLQHNTVHVYK